MNIRIEKTHTSDGRTSWWKRVTEVNYGEDSGYSFDGDFLNEGVNDIPAGSVLIHVRPQKSEKNPYVADVVVITTDKKLANNQAVATFNWVSELNSMRIKVTELLDAPMEKKLHPLAAFTAEELKAELKSRKL